MTENETEESQLDLDITDLFDALTDYHCTSYEDIGNVTGWNNTKVGSILTAIRKPETAQEWGWTVPHVERGTGVHWFQVISIEGGVLDDEQLLEIQKGAASTLRHTERMGLNEAHALRVSSKFLPSADARRLRRTAQALEGVAAMAGDMAEQVDASVAKRLDGRVAP